MVEHGEGGIHRRTDERRFRPVRRRFALKKQCHKIFETFFNTDLFSITVKRILYLHFKLGHLVGVELKNLQK